MAAYLWSIYNKLFKHGVRTVTGYSGRWRKPLHRLLTVNRRQLLSSVAAGAVLLLLPAPALSLLHGSVVGYSQQNPSFSGNPYVNITAIDVTGGIACSRSGTIYTPAFVMVSASNVTATGTSIPYEALEIGRSSC